MRNHRKRWSSLIRLSILIILIIGAYVRPTQACTVITTSTDEEIYFGYNEDRTIQQFDQETYINFKKETDDNLAYMEVIAISPTIFSIRCGMNEAGVAISGNGLNQYRINPHPERTYSRDTDSIYRTILEKARDIDEAIDIVNDFDFGSSMAFQIQVSDSNGDAFVASPGNDGEISISHKTSDYFISTNTNIVEVMQGTPDYKTDMGVAIIENRVSFDDDAIRDTLECLRSDSYEGYTYYTSIFDLKKRSVSFYLAQDFGSRITIDLDEELAKSDHYYMLKDLFPGGEKILNDMEASVRFQRQLFTASRLIGIGSVIILLRGLVVSSRKTWNIDCSMNWKIRSLFFLIIGMFYWSFIVLTVVQLFPALVLTNLLEKIIETSVVPKAIQYIALFWGSGVILGGFKLTRKKLHQFKFNHI